MAAVFEAAHRFFDQSQETKERIPRVDRYGFVPHAAHALDTTRQASHN